MNQNSNFLLVLSLQIYYNTSSVGADKSLHCFYSDVHEFEMLKTFQWNYLKLFSQSSNCNVMYGRWKASCSASK